MRLLAGAPGASGRALSSPGRLAALPGACLRPRELVVLLDDNCMRGFIVQTLPARVPGQPQLVDQGEQSTRNRHERHQCIDGTASRSCRLANQRIASTPSAVSSRTETPPGRKQADDDVLPKRCPSAVAMAFLAAGLVLSAEPGQRPVIAANWLTEGSGESCSRFTRS
jgi:hypothetical protein